MTFEIAYSCPLKIPKGHALMFMRQRRYDNGFPQSLTLDSALQYLEDELNALPDVHVSVYSNYDRINSPRTRAKREDDSAVCIEIKKGTRSYYLLSDHWYLIEHNLYALHLTIRAIRNMVKWGTATYEQALAGFDAAFVPGEAGKKAVPNDDALPEWMDVLGLGAHATLEDANAVYRSRAKEVANNEEALTRLNAAIDAARRYFGHS